MRPNIHQRIPPEMRCEILQYLKGDGPSLRAASLIQSAWVSPSRKIDEFILKMGQKRGPRELRQLLDDAGQEFKFNVIEIIAAGMINEVGTLANWMDELSASIEEIPSLTSLIICNGALAREAGKWVGGKRWKELKIGNVSKLTCLSLRCINLTGIRELMYVMAPLENLEDLEIKEVRWEEGKGKELIMDMRKMGFTRPPRKLKALDLTLLKGVALEEIGYWIGTWASYTPDLTTLKIRTTFDQDDGTSVILRGLRRNIRLLQIDLSHFAEYDLKRLRNLALLQFRMSERMPPGRYISQLSSAVASLMTGDGPWQLDIQWHDEWLESPWENFCWDELKEATDLHRDTLCKIRLVRTIDTWDGLESPVGLEILAFEGRVVELAIEKDYFSW